MNNVRWGISLAVGLVVIFGWLMLLSSQERAWEEYRASLPIASSVSQTPTVQTPVAPPPEPEATRPEGTASIPDLQPGDLSEMIRSFREFQVKGEVLRKVSESYGQD